MASDRAIRTVGYRAWPAPARADRRVGAPRDRGITTLIDVRPAPCSSDLDPGRPYGPRPWNLQAPGRGGSSPRSAARASPPSGSSSWATPSGGIRP